MQLLCDKANPSCGNVSANAGIKKPLFLPGISFIPEEEKEGGADLVQTRKILSIQSGQALNLVASILRAQATKIMEAEE